MTYDTRDFTQPSFAASPTSGSLTGGSNGTPPGTPNYFYDAEGRRIRKTTAGATVDYIYDLAGHVVSEVSSAGGWNRGEVYAGGRHLATYTGGTTYFDHTDWLGTERARTGVTGSSAETCTSLPFGDGQSCSGSDVSPNHFTGKERDTESGLDNFEARYNASSMGRFMNPDPKMPSLRHLANPQKWDKYVYVLNNPLALVDPDGREEVTVTIRAYIPQESFRFPPVIGPTWKGDGPAGHGKDATSYRVQATVKIETDQSVRKSSNPVVSVAGDTTGSSVNWYGLGTQSGRSNVSATASGTYDQNGNAVVQIKVSGSDPLAFGAPPAAGAFSVTVPQAADQITTTGTITPYPNWEGYASSQSGGQATLFQTSGSPDDTPANLFLGQSQGVASFARLVNDQE